MPPPGGYRPIFFRKAAPVHNHFASRRPSVIQRGQVQRTHGPRQGRPGLPPLDPADPRGVGYLRQAGAGGEGGSVTILGGAFSHRTRAMLEEIESGDSLYRRVPLSLSWEGLRTWERAPLRPTAS